MLTRESFPHKSSIADVDANIIVLIAYLAPVVLSWVPGVRYAVWVLPLILFFIEEKSDFVRFHALQSLILHAISALISFVFSFLVYGIILNFIRAFQINFIYMIISGIVSIVSSIITLVLFIVIVLCAVYAFGYRSFEVPVIAPLAHILQTKFTKK
ncbi:MAG: hypothetical protein ACRCZJ_03340 [Erysipelotrichaceae bacterium]